MMMIRPWHPATAPEAEIGAWCALHNASFARDLPGEPVWVTAGLREWLAADDSRMPREFFVAEDGQGIMGGVEVAYPQADNTHMAQVWLIVRPECRRRGVGSALLDTVVRQIRQWGRRLLTTVVVEGSDGGVFVERLGLQCVLSEVRSILTMAEVDWEQITTLAAASHPGYSLRYWLDELPEEWMQGYAHALGAMNDAPVGGLEKEPVTYSLAAVRERVTLHHARGNRFHRLIAVHDASGEVAGLTEVLRCRTYQTRADQGDTCVAPAHRGHGLGLWLKAAMLLRLREAEPGLVDIQTWNAESNRHMLAVNDAHGYRGDRRWLDYQGNIDDLTDRMMR
jgi:GNAT superfamily N-acetyltransferase